MSRTCATLLFMFVVLSAGTSAYAQIQMNLQCNHKNYLQYEPVYIRLKLRNFSGRPIPFSESKNFKGKLCFEIDNLKNGRRVHPTNGQTPPLEGLLLEPGVTKIVEFPLSKYYRLTEKGKYRIKALIEHPLMPSKWESSPESITISGGVTVWERPVGVPIITSDGNRKIETRNAKIVSFYDGKDKYFFFMLEDKKCIYEITRMGYDLGASLPECEVDPLSRIHVVLQVGPKLFTYFVYDINGKLLNRQNYNKTESKPSLYRDPDTGEVHIVGGEKAIEDVHYTEEKYTLFDNDKKNENVRRKEAMEPRQNGSKSLRSTGKKRVLSPVPPNVEAISETRTSAVESEPVKPKKSKQTDPKTPPAEKKKETSGWSLF